MTLRDHARQIWQAGVDAVRAERLVAGAVSASDDELCLAGERFRYAEFGRLVVVGAGKAGAGMAAAVEQAIGNHLPADRRSGWVNVPADCVRPTNWIHLHAGRPAGVNAPTTEGVAGTRRILELVRAQTANDLCLVLLSGGGSALLVAPRDGITLADKQAVTRLLSERGATIEELNCVRRALSDVKGGGLLRACGAGRVIALIISDVIGDSLPTIASGPTVPSPTSEADALDVLHRFAPHREAVPAAVWQVLEAAVEAAGSQSLGVATPAGESTAAMPDQRVRTHIIGNNRTACEAAASAAQRLGYDVAAIRPEEAGIARDAGQALADEARAHRDSISPLQRPRCIVSGGEPVVHLVPGTHPHRGGRNQELVLAALERLWEEGLDRIAILSGGTDGEDGPTDAAGAVADEPLRQTARQQGLAPRDYLQWNNSYPFFEQTGGLLQTGPTHTNVMDLRITLITPPQNP